MKKFESEIKTDYLIKNLSIDEIVKKYCVTTEYVESIIKKTKKIHRSKGEAELIDVLLELFPFDTIEEQYLLENRRFDFCLLKKRVLIEWDGIQHSEVSSLYHGTGFQGQLEFEKQISIDKKKDSIAKNNFFHLIRLPHTTLITTENIRNIFNEQKEKIQYNLTKFSENFLI